MSSRMQTYIISLYLTLSKFIFEILYTKSSTISRIFQELVLGKAQSRNWKNDFHPLRFSSHVYKYILFRICTYLPAHFNLSHFLCLTKETKKWMVSSTQIHYFLFALFSPFFFFSMIFFLFWLPFSLLFLLQTYWHHFLSNYNCTQISCSSMLHFWPQHSVYLINTTGKTSQYISWVCNPSK